MAKEERQKTTVVLPADLMKKAKIRAIEEDCTLAKLIENAVTEHLKKPRPSQRRDQR